MPKSPTTARREFGNRLRRRRIERHLTAAKVADGLALSRVYYSKIENAHAVLADARLADLAALLSFDKTETADLAELLQAARGSGWWERYGAGPVVVEPFVEFLGLEQGASRARIFEGRVMTGLAQTRAYATAVMAASPEVRRDEAWQAVDVRMRRQERLQDADPLEVDLIISEAVLMQQFGGPEILRDQLRQLASLIDASTMRVRVQPFENTPLGMSASSTVVLLDFSSEHLPTIAWVEGGGQVATLTDDDVLVQSLVVNYELALTSCLGELESRRLIERRIEELAAGG